MHNCNLVRLDLATSLVAVTVALENQWTTGVLINMWNFLTLWEAVWEIRAFFLLLCAWCSGISICLRTCVVVPRQLRGKGVSFPVTNDNSFILEPTRYILSVNVNIYNVIKLAREEWKYKWYENKTMLIVTLWAL